MKSLLNVVRWIVGLLFIFSGLIKANDPLGLSYKMQEFFEVWNLHGFHDYTLTLSVLMIAFEIIAGVAVIVGWKMRLVSWLLLLLIIFFTFLTAYALFSGKIKTCGCFGDCIPLTAQTSFIKDLILLVLILFLFVNTNKIKASVSSGVSVVILIITTILSFGFQWYVLKYLPVFDCLPYKVGNNISQEMKIPEGAIPDSAVITFVYQKAGQEIEFTADKFPDDFNDATYTFLKRYDKLIRKGNAEPAIKDFSIIAPSGVDTTQEILATPGPYLILFNKDDNTDWEKWQSEFLALKATATKRNMPFYLVTSNAASLSAFLSKIGMPAEPVYQCDAVAVKTASRTNPSLYLLHEGTIAKKWSYAHFDKALKYIENSANSK